jgi:methionyl-tRNA formyltransferase
VLRIATGDGWLEPRVLQRAGRRALDVGAFLSGRPVADGARLGL